MLVFKVAVGGIEPRPLLELPLQQQTNKFRIFSTPFY